MFKILPACGGVLMVLTSVTLAQAAADNPHLITRQDPPATCTACHDSAPELKDDNGFTSKNLPLDWPRFNQNGVAMCASCHDVTAYHKVNLNVDFPSPADLPLNPDHEIVCETCHYTHGRLDSDKPQASFCFLDRLLDDQRLHKSFLLRRDNSDGGLCLTCHNPDQGSKQ
ncbi:MAG: hypothetical protein EPN21_13990 [Methylococcaceae bacterium]|nr:MAG: hypothetical protein EPN21_13990 [Methylococcaceae bacterium]